LCAFLCAIDGLLKRAKPGGLDESVYVVYVSSLKALGNNVEKNLQAPPREILPSADQTVRRAVRTGDTPASERRRMVKTPLHILVTTPESLYIPLTSKSGRKMLAGVESVIVDEIHAIANDKRGAHVALTLERLERPTDHPLRRIGLSATQRPLETVAKFLVGNRKQNCSIVDVGHRCAMDLEIVVPRSSLSAVMAEEVWSETLEMVAGLVQTHSTTLVFVNTLRMAERLTGALEDMVGADVVTSHHGSLCRAHRLRAEKELKAGTLKAMVATASMELGLAVGEIDLVCQIGTTRSTSTMLQRAGRPGHGVGRMPKARLFPCRETSWWSPLPLSMRRAATTSSGWSFRKLRSTYSPSTSSRVSRWRSGERMNSLSLYAVRPRLPRWPVPTLMALSRCSRTDSRPAEAGAGPTSIRTP
jgi:ATP-dependent Lhr-like helicase